MKKIVKIFILVVAIFSLNINVNASTNTKPRTETNLGVNKKWNITSTNKDNVLKTKLVDASEHIYDFADVITDEEEQELFNKIEQFVNKANMDMVILTIDEQMSDAQIETYATDFYDYNDFGINYKLYDGILIVRNANSYNRFFNIYTFGNAQLYFTYDRCEIILDEIFYDIKNDNYLNGFTNFIDLSTVYYINGIPSTMKNYYVDDMGYLREKFIVPWAAAIIISGLVTTIIIFVMYNKNKMVKKAKRATEYINKESLKFNLKRDDFINTRTTSYTVTSSSGSSGSGSHSSHSGSSGGGHGGGGGRHG